jgi:hypothetical protein
MGCTLSSAVPEKVSRDSTEKHHESSGGGGEQIGRAPEQTSSDETAARDSFRVTKFLDGALPREQVALPPASRWPSKTLFRTSAAAASSIATPTSVISTYNGATYSGGSIYNSTFNDSLPETEQTLPQHSSSSSLHRELNLSRNPTLDSSGRLTKEEIARRTTCSIENHSATLGTKEYPIEVEVSTALIYLPLTSWCLSPL